MFLTFRKLLKIMRNHHKLYLKVDIYYWSVCFKRLEKNLQIGLDYAYYLSSLGYSWDVMLKLTDVNLKLISDIQNYQSVKSTIKCEISLIFKGYAEAHNKFLKLYVVNKPTSYIIYLDANDLYGHSIMQLLPIEMHGWVNPKDFNLDNYLIQIIIQYIVS